MPVKAWKVKDISTNKTKLPQRTNSTGAILFKPK